MGHCDASLKMEFFYQREYATIQDIDGRLSCCVLN